MTLGNMISKLRSEYELIQEAIIVLERLAQSRNRPRDINKRMPGARKRIRGERRLNTLKPRGGRTRKNSNGL